MTENEQEEQSTPLFRIRAGRKEELMTVLKEKADNKPSARSDFVSKTLPGFLEGTDGRPMNAGIITSRLIDAEIITARHDSRFTTFISKQKNIDKFLALIEGGDELTNLVNALPTKQGVKKNGTAVYGDNAGGKGPAVC